MQPRPFLLGLMVFLGATGGALAAAHVPAECKCQKGDMERLGIIELLLASGRSSAPGAGLRDPVRTYARPRGVGGEYVILGGAAGTPLEKTCGKKDPVCRVDVRIEHDKAGTCFAVLDYCRLCVRQDESSSTKKKARFTLKVDKKDLPAGAAFEFDAADGIRLKDDAGADLADGNPIKDRHFKRHPREDKNQVFVLESAEITTSLPLRGMRHDAKVWRTIDGRRDDEPCIPKDPIIVNTTN